MPASRDISLRQIEAFNAVMEAGSVTGAAEMMHVTQPAVSRLIRDLQFNVGFPLFERAKGRIMPTIEAKALFEEVRRSYVGLEKIVSAASEIRNFRAGYLQIAALPAMSLRFLPRVITAFSDANPGINISLHVRSSVRVSEWVASQQIDAGFAALQSAYPGIEQLTLYSGALVAVLPAGHRLTKEKVLTPEKLAGERLVSLGSEYSIRQRTMEAFALAGVPFISRIEVQLAQVVCEFVADGAGVGLVEPATAFEMADRGLEIRPFEPSIPYFVSLLLPLNRTEPLFFGSFMKLLLPMLAENPYMEISEAVRKRFDA
ncbi:MAG: LysR substrate-binding domain-containing protein [Tepidamorphaceae bacterium]|nr:LysR family transcriptional regulator [Rhodobiaceae bacterium]MCC0049725.1 LysR family transcriptional regulator [Rhodobiaceae bacterium]